MSDPLDRMFRDAQNKVPYATPPKGQWDKIRRRESVSPASKEFPLLGGWVLGLLLGLGAGLPLGGYFFGASCPEAIDNVPIAELQTSEVAKELVLVGGDIAPSTTTAPATAPKKQVYPKDESHSFFGKSPKKSTNPASSKSQNICSKTVPTTKTANLGAGVDSTISDDLAKLNLPPKERASVGLSPLTDSNELLEPVLSSRNQSIQGDLASFAHRTPINPPKKFSKKANPSGRWETGLHITPWLSEASTGVFTYTETMNGNSPRAFTVDGSDVVLYPVNTLNPNLNERLQVRFLSFDVARQFSNGLRVGVGLFWQPRISRGLINEQEYLNAQLLAGEWARYVSVVTQTLSTSLSVDYTFRRRKRFRPYLGVTLQSNFYQDGNSAQFLFERESGRVEELYRVYSINSADFGNLRILPRTGFQYELTDHLSVGMEIIPGIGVGGRWRW